MSRRFVDSRGMSLIEVMISGSLAVLVLSVLVGLVIPSMRYLHRGSRQSSLGQEAMLLADRLERDVAACAFPTLSYHPRQTSDPPDEANWLYAGKLRTTGAARDQVWDESCAVAYRFRPGQQSSGLPIVSRIDQAQAATSGRKLPPKDDVVAAFLAGVPAQGETDIAPHLREMSWQPLAGQSLIQLSLTFMRDDLSGAPLSLKTEIALVPRNTLRTSASKSLATDTALDQ